MASKKDLIEAQAFSRKRLLTAFTSGAPGGKELEPASPLRSVIAGLALAVIVIVGGVFYGLTRPGLTPGWESNKLVMVTDTGARYLSIGGTLYPILNATSARLLVPAGELSVLATDSSAIRGIPVGPTIGILGAPDDVPPAANLVGEGWTACPVEGGTAVDIPGLADAAFTDAGIVVRSGAGRWVVAGGYRYPVDAANSDPILRAVGLANARVLEVDSRWLNLFAEGDPLEPLEVPQAGEVVPGTALIIGTVLQPQGSDTRFLVTPDGTVESLSPLAYQLYLLGTGAILGGERAVAPSEFSALRNAEVGLTSDSWPQEPLAPVPVDQRVCATLTHDALELPVTLLSVTGEAAEAPGVQVALRSGALVAAGGAGDQGTRFLQLIDESGTAFALPDADDEILARLGYARTDVTTATSAWLQFFASGPALTPQAAGSSPQTAVANDAEAGAEPGLVVAPSIAEDTSPSLAPSPEPAPAAPAASSVVGVDAVVTQCEAGVVSWIPSAPSALSLVQSVGAWQHATGTDVLIAVVDSGIDASNPHLEGVVVGGINLVPDGERPDGLSDVAGHGTAVAGVIAARPVEGSGVIGLAPQAELLSVRVFRDSSEKSREEGFGPEPARLAEGIRWAADQGARIINVSMSVEADLPEVRSAVDYATSLGALIVASGGNRSTADSLADTPRYPAAYPGVLAVAAADRTGRVTDSSIHGPHIEIAAPGQDISTAMADGGDCTYAVEAPSSSYATGYAAAAAALVMDAHPTETAEQVKYRLMATAVRDRIDVRDDIAGWGLVQPLDAIMLLPGADVRGPENVFVEGEVQAIGVQAVSVTTSRVVPAVASTQQAATLAGVLGAVALGVIAVGLVYRRRSEAQPAPADRGPGFLGSMRQGATTIREDEY